MKTEETLLDGQTAGFIAAIANAVGRSIGSERMKQLIAEPAELKRLLLPLIHDDWQAILPAVAEASGGYCLEGTNSKLVWLTMNTASSGNPPTMRRLMTDAYRRIYSPLLKEEAWKLAAHVFKADFCSAKSTGRPRCIFPYCSDRWHLRTFVVEGSTKSRSHGYLETEVDLDNIDQSLMGSIVFFKEGHDDRSNCFEC